MGARKTGKEKGEQSRAGWPGRLDIENGGPRKRDGGKKWFFKKKELKGNDL